MNATSSSLRALVLGGGGSAGNAWLIGVLAGLAEAGLDVTGADLIIGTSAGATAAAQITGAPLSGLLSDVLETPPTTGLRGAGPMIDHLQRTDDVIAAAASPLDMRRRLAASALALAESSDPARHARWRAVVSARLPRDDWPDTDLLITAVDARTGEPVEFRRDSGIDLIDAVAASTSGGPAYGIGDDLYIDGGYRRSSENADLAAGYGRVLVLSPLGGRTRAPLKWGLHLAVQVDELRAGGSRVETILPDAASLAAFGDNMMDPSTRAPAARAGYEQGSGLAEPLGAFWR